MARTHPGAGTLPVHSHPLPLLKPTAAVLPPGSLPAALRPSLAPPSSAGNTMQCVRDGCFRTLVAHRLHYHCGVQRIAMASAEGAAPWVPTCV